MKDYRVKVTIRNDRLLTAMEGLGYKSVKEFARINKIGYGHTASIISGKVKPINEKGFRKIILISFLLFFNFQL